MGGGALMSKGEIQEDSKEIGIKDGRNVNRGWAGGKMSRRGEGARGVRERGWGICEPCDL